MSKKYFGTDGVRGTVGKDPMTADFALRLASAAAQVLVPAGGTVVIGKDTRVSGYMFESALEAGFTAAGADVLLLGPLPTPGVAYLTNDRLFIRRDGPTVAAVGIPKLPRVNPGTIVHNPRLSSLLPEEHRHTYDMHQVLARLVDDGLFVMDLHGGSESTEEMEETRRCGGFTQHHFHLLRQPRLRRY